eukprot:gene806-7890_t
MSGEQKRKHCDTDYSDENDFTTARAQNVGLELTPTTLVTKSSSRTTSRTQLSTKYPHMENPPQELNDSGVADDCDHPHAKYDPSIKNNVCSPHRVHAFSGAVTKAEAKRYVKSSPHDHGSTSFPPRRRIPHSDVMSLHYVDAIYAKNLERESRYLLNTHPPRKLNMSMRTVVVDWMIEIQTSFRLHEETLFLAVDILDRYFAANEQESRYEYQCCGATALWITSKFIEVLPPELADFEYVCAGLYSRDHFIAKELKMLTALQFLVMSATPLDFISIYAIVLQLSLEGMALAEYMITLPLQEARFYGLRPSLRGAAAAHIASKTCGGTGWTEEHSQIFRIEYRHVFAAAERLKELAEEQPSQYLNARKKFLDP